jgi:iron complex outermembrane receptor protein
MSRFYSSRYETNRSAITTAAPVDVISGETLAKSGNVELGKAMTEVIPSFNSQRQTFSDGTDHIDPATLRGLGPDQVLVLINGKRRHTTALVNVTPVVGKGAVGTDLNAIPVSAVERIEVLRDGASAIYGSDAIAGVINIVLKKSSDFELSTNAGQTIEGDGQYFFAGANTGISMNDGGFINFTGELRRREPTDRAGDYTGAIFSDDPAEDERILNERGLTRDYFDLKIGNSAQTNAGFFVNSEIPVNENSNIFFFGGINYRDSRSPGLLQAA